MCACRSHASKSTFKVLFDTLRNRIKFLTVSQGKTFWQLGLTSFPPTFPWAPPRHCHLLVTPPQTCSPIPGQRQHLAHLGSMCCFLATLAKAAWGDFFPPAPLRYTSDYSSSLPFLHSIFSLHDCQFANNLLAVWCVQKIAHSTQWHP